MLVLYRKITYKCDTRYFQRDTHIAGLICGHDCANAKRSTWLGLRRLVTIHSRKK
jgi:hypothetical protein